MKDIITLDQNGKLLSNLHWHNCLDELPPLGKLVLGYVPFRPVYIDGKHACYDIVYREMMPKSCIENRFMGNNLREYEWHSTCSTKYFGQSVVAWADIDKPEEMDYPCEFETLKHFYIRTGKIDNLSQKDKEYLEYLDSILEEVYVNETK